MMAGYREHSFDPNAYERQGPPARPFNWVQWTGAAFMAAAIVFDLAYVAGQFGWIHNLIDSPMPGTGMIIAGVSLVNSRRQPVVDQAPELAAARRRWLVIVVSVCAVILGVATIFAMKGY